MTTRLGKRSLLRIRTRWPADSVVHRERRHSLFV
jgi:hypothetical protein